MVSNSNMSSANLSVAKMNFMEISSLAEQFVLQYYVVMDKCPELLHRFYGENSRVIYESSPICGQHDIHEAFSKLKLSDTRVVLHTVDALKANENSVMVQVCGEISVAGGEPRRFMRSFTLCEKTQSDFYVLSDIFRYQDRVYIPEPNDTNPSPVPVAEPKESKKSAPEKKINAKPNGVAHTQKQQWQRPQPQEKKHDVPSPPVTNSVEQEPRKVESPAPRSITPKAKLDESHHPIEQPVMPDPVPQPSTAAPMSWAQRASGIAAASSTASHMPQPQPPQSTKPISNPESVPASTGSQRNSHKSQRGPRQQQADTRRDSNSDRSDYYQQQQQQPQAPQQQQGFPPSGGRGHAGPRGGGRGTRGAMLSRGGGGSNRGTAGAPLRR